MCSEAGGEREGQKLSDLRRKAGFSGPRDGRTDETREDSEDEVDRAR